LTKPLCQALSEKGWLPNNFVLDRVDNPSTARLELGRTSHT